MRILLLLSATTLASALSSAALVFFTPTNATWRMLKGVAEASSPDVTAWRLGGFDDSAWTNVPAPFYYSTAPVEPPFFNGGTFTGTLLGDMQFSYSCVFFRKIFVVSNAMAIAQLNLDLANDDGFIAWINGIEIARQNVPAGNVPFNGFALLAVVEPVPLAAYLITNAGGLLTDGNNVLAVQGFNRSLDSSDFGFMAGLSFPEDDVPPIVVSLIPPAGSIVRELVQIEVTFSESITGIDAGDLLINGVPAIGLATKAPATYVFDFPQPTPGVVSLAWNPSQGITDLATNSFAGGSWSCFLDTNGAAGSAVITEFLAANDQGLLDEDGDASDWIEIHNPGLAALPLDGWFLTDDANNLMKWRFPATNLAANAYLVVFASGKNRAVPGAPLHTNFKLAAAGGYLGLVRPDGVTVASEFSPVYPKQHTDVSFGISRQLNNTQLLSAGAPAQILIPTDGSLALQWTGGAEPFADSGEAGWLAGRTGVGFDQSGVGALQPLGYWSFDDASNPAQAIDVSGHNHHGTIFGATYTADAGGRSGRMGDRAMNFGPAGNGAYVNIPDAALGLFDSATAHDALTVSLWIFGDASEPANTSAFYASGNPDGSGVRAANAHLPWSDSVIYWDTGGWDLATERVFIPEPDPSKWKGRWNHYLFLKNGSIKQIWQNGVLILSGTNTASLYMIRGFVIGDGAGLPTWSYGGLIDDFAVWDVALSPPQIQALAAGASPLDLESLSTFIGTDVAARMWGRSASAYIRVPFTVESPINFDLLLLRMRYDDGFVCYLNGIEVVRLNAPAQLDFNSSATVKRTKAAASQAEEIDLSAFVSVLNFGTNILAIHGLNSTADDPDFLMLPELVTGQTMAERYFLQPTPGAPNGPSVAGFVADTTFSVDRGFFFAPTNVTIRCATPGATLVYTIDGSEPSLNHGVIVNAPDSNTPPAFTVQITNTTTLRAAAFRQDYQPTDIDTQTYLFPAQVANQIRPSWVAATWPDGAPTDFTLDPRVVDNALPGYSFTNALLAIPTVSITTDGSNLFSASSGIYANALATGPAWERPASAELIYPDGRAGFHINCGVRIHGGASRYNAFTPKHAFNLLFRQLFGPTKLDFQVFPDSDVRKFDQLVLRACSTDSWPVVFGNSLNGEPYPRWTREEASYMRDQWMRDAQLDLGHPSCHGFYVHLYLNGIYWGLYNLTERPDESFAAAYFGGTKDEYDVVADFAELKAGDLTVWNEMIALAASGFGSDQAYQQIQGNNPDGTRNPAYPIYLDLTNLVDFIILHTFSGADDWPDHNWWASRRRGTNSAGFRFLVWDQEIANNSLQRTRTSWLPYPLYADVNTYNTPAYLYAQLRQNAEFRLLYADRVHHHLFNDGPLTVASNIPRWQVRHTEIDQAVVAESARWGDYQRPTQPYRREVEWVSNQTWMVTSYWPSNQALALNRFRNAGLYPGVGAPSFAQFGGHVPTGFPVVLTHTNASGTIYFTTDTTDPRQKGGAIGPTAQPYVQPIVLVSPTLIRARVQSGGVWSAIVEAQFFTPQDFTKLQLSEIMYHPPNSGLVDGDQFEFLELENLGGSTLDLSGLTFTAGISFTFAIGTQLSAGQFFVLVRNPAEFAAKYPNVPFNGVYTGKLDNGGETLTLSHPLGGTIFSVTYDDSPPWPAGADGFGLSLQRVNTAGNANAPNNWTAAPPTPGAPVPPELVDTDGDGLPDVWEIAHHTDPNNPDSSADPDHDGMTNLEEFIAGTDPWDGNSRLQLKAVEARLIGVERSVVLRFQAVSNKTYTLVARDSAQEGGWTAWASVAAEPVDRQVTVTNIFSDDTRSRFYRLVTPPLP